MSTRVALASDVQVTMSALVLAVCIVSIGAAMCSLAPAVLGFI